TGYTDRLSVFVDSEGEPDGVAGQWREFLSLSIAGPLHGLEAADLKRYRAGEVSRAVLRESDCVSSVVDPVHLGVDARRQRGKSAQGAVRPTSGKTPPVGTESAKVFAQGVHGRGFGNHGHLCGSASLCRHAVAQGAGCTSQSTEIRHVPLVPEICGLGETAGVDLDAGCGAAGYHAGIVDTVGVTVSAA